MQRKVATAVMALLFFMTMALLFSITCVPAQHGPEGLRCEHRTGDVLIDTQSPRLSWVNHSHQTAYRIIVSTSENVRKARKAVVWDSGKVVSEESHLVPYPGPGMEPMKSHFWSVMTWDGEGKPSKWSETARWTTGMMDKGDWKAGWIGAPWQEDTAGAWYPVAPMFRKEFEVRKGLASAKAFVCGLGWFEMRVNGRKVGDDHFVPAFTDYTRRPGLDTLKIPVSPDIAFHRTLYLAYDITPMLHKGGNAVGAILGNGYFHSDPGDSKCETFGVPRLICQILLTYKDGGTELVSTDTSWKASESPITYNDLYGGETYDASREEEGWDRAGFDDSSWQDAVARKAPDGPLTANMAPTDKVTGSLKPISFEKQEDGSWKVDFGTEISGWVRFSGITGHAGDTLKVEYVSESRNGICEYAFKDGRPVSWAPRFDWYVFREAVIRGIPSLEPSQLVAEAVNTDLAVSSDFHCSNPLFVKVNDIWKRSQMDNMHGAVASDCPHRERLPYTGDGQVAMNTVMANFDAAAFYNKWIEDIRGSQVPATGYVPNGAPWEPNCGGGPAWGAAICIMPLEFFLQYGDYGMLGKNLPAMEAYVRWFGTWRREDGTVLVEMKRPWEDEPFFWFNLGDWVPAYDSPERSLVHTFYYWLCVRNVAKAALALKDMETASKYEQLSQDIRDSFHRAYYNAGEKGYGDFGSNVYALAMGVPESCLQDVKATLREELEVKYNRHLNTGMLSTRFLFEVLSLNGMVDLAYSIMDQRDFPGFGWMVEQGATTTWEQWDGVNSRNHPMLGGGLTWFYKMLAGVDTDPSGPGFRHVIIRPIPARELPEASYSTMTPYGRLSSRVTHDGTTVCIEATIPYGSKATIYIPKSVQAAAADPLSDSAYTVKEVGPGNWRFQSTR